MYLPSFPQVDHFSAGINALNGVLVARNKSHDRGYTVIGLLIMAFFGGIGGGMSRDMMLAQMPSPLQDPAYFIICLVSGFLGMAIYRYLESKEEQFRTRTLAFFKSFSLPWFAALGAHKALEHNLGIGAAIMVGVIATTAGGIFIDLFSGVTPEIVMPSEQLVTTALISSSVYAAVAIAMKDSNHFFPITLLAVGIGFIFRLFAVRNHWPSIVPHDQTVPASSDGKPHE
jgi:uncharacterized membrane protein YeiH